MALYAITATRIINYELEVEATSEKEAMLIAERADISEFGECGGEFTIDYADEIK
jgi:hypothetical protein